jgi:pyridoxamine 5'-phosphate oxidase
MTDENEFLAVLKQLEETPGGTITRPSNWGGFKLLPSLFEFWTHRDNRRHERLQFEKAGPLWKLSRLYP